MLLSNEQVVQIQKLYKEHFGKNISREEAYDSGSKLLRLFKLISQPITHEQYHQVQERRKELGLSQLTGVIEEP